MDYNTVNFNIEKQNSKEMLDLLSAQRNIYSNSKRISLYAFIISMIPISLKLFIKNEYLTNLSNVVVPIITLVLLLIIDKKVKTAASIQEEFDVKIFGIPSNSTLFSNKVNIKTINKNSKSTNRDELVNWYSKPKSKNDNVNVLICQSNNTFWNLNLNKLCRNLFLFGLIIILLAYPMLKLFINSQSVNSYYISLISPIMSLIKHLINLFKIVKIEEELYNNIKKHIVNKNISIEYLRQVQDKIYTIRCNTYMVPDFLYKITRKKNEEIMSKYTENISKTIE